MSNPTGESILKITASGHPRIVDQLRSPSGWMLFAASFAVKCTLIAVLVAPRHNAWVHRFTETGGTQYDDVEYFQTAQALAKHHVFANPKVTALSVPQIYRTPIYPLFLAVLGIVCHWNPLGMLLLQAAILSLAPWLLRLILLRAGYPSGFAWLLVLDPITNILAVTFMTEGLFVLFLLAGFYFLLQAQYPGPRLAALVALALAILVKPSTQFLFGLIGIYLLLRYPPPWQTLGLILLSVLPLVGWMVRNYRVAGLFVISTQTDVTILIPETIKAKQAGVADQDILAWIDEGWTLAHSGQHISPLVMDNKFDFKGVAIQYAVQHPATFIKYHILGSLRVLFGTARNHLKVVFQPAWSPGAWRLFDSAMVGFYLLLYIPLLLSFRPRGLLEPAIGFAWVFILYNTGLIGVLAYATGGGLKRAPFVPFLMIALAGQCAQLLRHRRGPAQLPGPS